LEFNPYVRKCNLVVVGGRMKGAHDFVVITV
jgi:hypothetical protein